MSLTGREKQTMAKRGGYRVGAGRPKGSLNRTTAPTGMPRTSGAPGTMTPLDYLLALVNDETATPERRDRAAIAACAYCHPRIAATMGARARAAKDALTAGEGTDWGDDLGDVVN
jgi:hypothetical protein